MDIKQATITRVKQKLIEQQSRNKHHLNRNKAEMRRLVEESTLMKRENAEFGRLLRDLDGRSNNNPDPVDFDDGIPFLEER